MNIGFSGHRNKFSCQKDLEEIVLDYPNAIWFHGGAKGFDTQVEEFARHNGIETRIIKPNYNKYGRAAPLIRNRLIISLSDILIACYDGREYGGTYYTIKQAKKKHLTIRFTRIEKQPKKVLTYSQCI